ncbi:hypothetical protein JW926_04095 [Candidatus Sumerlaeota bacterium]|nr:hypothetical protein [Candidatus Sumerlaeota bacterium]
MSRKTILAILIFILYIYAEGTAMAELSQSDVNPAHPRPDFERSLWASLDGLWDFAYDDQDVGLKNKWFDKCDWARKIRAPFTHQARLSGIGETEHHRVVWYHRPITRPETFPLEQRVRLHFGAADFRATVWLNGKKLGEHEGGYTPFSFDIEDYLKDGENRLVVRVFDDALDPAQPRGKQNPSGKLSRWHYTHITGLWQSVWLESVPRNFLETFRVYTSEIADPRYLYWCDKLGLMVWGEMANAGEGHFSKRAADISLREWERVINRDFNHPCIIAWVYSNEHWMHSGRDAEERLHYLHAYQQLKAWDSTRPVIDTSGWFHIKTDIFDFHGVPELQKAQSWLDGTLNEIVFRPDVCFFDKEKPDLLYHGWPLLISEWVIVSDFAMADEKYYEGYEKSILPLTEVKAICGQIYVQLYDVENERNGYLTYDRRWKVDPDRIKATHEKFAAAASK